VRVRACACILCGVARLGKRARAVPELLVNRTREGCRSRTVCVCVCVRVREHPRERESDGQTERDHTARAYYAALREPLYARVV
jgi:hypothetical protein